MEQQRVTIKFPTIQIKFGDTTIDVPNWEGKVKNLAEVNQQIQYTLKQACDNINKLFSEQLQATLILESGQEVVVPCHALISWKIESHASEDLLNITEESKLSIRFGSKRHRLLWSTQDSRLTRFNQDSTRLMAAGYIEGIHITEKGRQQLKKLYQEGPRDKRSQIYVAEFLLNVLKGQFWFDYLWGPVTVYVVGQCLVKEGKRQYTSSKLAVTDKGKEWLRERSDWLVDEPRIQKWQPYNVDRVLQLISLLPEAALNKFLVSEKEAYRIAAERRYVALTVRRVETRGN